MNRINWDNVLRLVAIVLWAGFFLFVGLSLAVNAETVDTQETCPSGDGWVKIEPLDGYSYTFTDIPEGYEVTDNCYKAGQIVQYGTGPTVTRDGDPELSHASFLLVPKEVPPSTTTTLPGETTTTTDPTDTTTTTIITTTTTPDTPTTTSTTVTPEESTTTTTTTVPPSFTTTPPPSQPELPMTGVSLGWWALAGALFTVAGLGLLAVKAER